MEFSERIEGIMRHYGLNSKELADKCGVQRTAINHILNGRNRPSVGFLSALSESFPELNTRWLLHGKGAMFTNVTHSEPSKPEQTDDVTGITGESSIKPATAIDRMLVSLPTTAGPPETIVTEQPGNAPRQEVSSPRIVQVIVLYSDGTCRTYRHQE